MKNEAFPLPVNQTTGHLAGSGDQVLFKKQLVLLGLFAGVGLFGLLAFPRSVEGERKKVKLQLPSRIGAWSARDSKVNPFIYEALRPDAVLQKRFTLVDPKNASSVGKTTKTSSRPTEVEMLVVYTHSPEGFHPPDVCMTMQGWEIVKREQRPVSDGHNRLIFDVVTGEQKEMQRQLAYRFTDASGEVAGRTETFANMVMARLLRQRVGALEIQFAYTGKALDANGNFIPQFQQLMVKGTAMIRQQLASENKA